PPVKPPVVAPKKASLPAPRPTPTPHIAATATALPTALPTATVAPVTPTVTSRPKAACSSITCAMGKDAILQAGVWLLLLLLLVWFRAGIVVARVRQLNGQTAMIEREKGLAALTASDPATPEDRATADDVALDLQDNLPSGLLATVPDQASPLDA